MEQTSEFKTFRTGDLEMLYGHGEIRRISLGGTCILSAIYGAVRDKNWGRVPGRIHQESIHISEDGFIIRLQLDYREADIRFRAMETIEGKGNSLSFSFQGQAESHFLKNRIGLNILHPIRECKGKKLEVRQVDGSTTIGRFPELISPDQPFSMLRGMSWKPITGLRADLSYEGEVFEMEDQRNWTDASYKTYSTPLHEPFPVKMQAGESIQQVVRLHVKKDPSFRAPETSRKLLLAVQPEISYSLPGIGIGRPAKGVKLLQREAEWLKQVLFSHYRVDLWLDGRHWKAAYEDALREQEKLGWPWQLVLHVGPNFQKELDAFVKHYLHEPARLCHILLFENQRLAGQHLLNTSLPLLKTYFPGIPLGSGTDAYFAELSRNFSPAGSLDYLSFSICPQVHAFDELTLIENTEAQADAVESAQYLFQKPVVICAVTLKQRFNVVATDQTEKTGAVYPESDHRQPTVFAAAWTLACIRQMVRAGIKAVTFYETLGKRGILDKGKEGLVPFPLYYLFEEICSGKHQNCISSKSSHPLSFEALLLESALHRTLLVASFAPIPLEVEVSEMRGSVEEVCELSPAGWIKRSGSEIRGLKIQLKPLSFLRIKISR